MTDFAENMMKRAVSLARKGVGKTAPNPAVGCVIVKDGAIVGEGWHRKAGTPHAEIHALRQAGALAEGADVFVTLEPCSHFGKTPPCADALIAAKVARVYVGMVDPNPRVCGKGISKLRAAGIQVEAPLLEEKCRALNEPFIKHVTTGLPFVILKTAMTMDGKIATAGMDSKWVTSEKSRRYVHKLRSELDVIMVGVGTIIKDDPLLTSRIPGGRNPLRVVVDSKLRIPPDAHVLHCDSTAKTVVATISSDEAQVSRLAGLGAEVLSCGEDGDRVDLCCLMAKLGKRGVQSVLLEGGAELAGEALRKGIIDKCMFFYAPKLVAGDGLGPFAGNGAGKMADALKLQWVTVTKIGVDILVQGYPEKICLQG
ncbi:2,5-diamino-6-(5'-phosphoribosylamino)-4-(3H)-pyrimidinone deaminase and 5-amino-6-(5'-phosphoribosylamino)uracil reductase [Geotalea daltonii FRC-32]|uniref:Riboflavin biosynthesis protein RibD n=1 Tax=Geotalea daltonii (strain DSM 22248 / JCM 15807 / FRC-32) TaxID=316067 RepID=B9M1E3_GEODF|nr:bifunctional diaminohydroxyphosphoribosylaminopyrimidine deaminase/5-amino-6-(5-phosphoribosylamino)uracil reductase RibD [Geotalea daltonii]ACM21025.1 2,5-diamino-6-(5'-phosphoribosylamino)-4-(3H)-pyrimidinone deaminase and 5-amino-6-(5'-phosphoribosylamino)uracil reductase [Geotalea daltonii FRC-32]